MTYSELMADGVKLLSDAGFLEARTDVRALLFHVCGMDFMSFMRDGALEASAEQEESFRRMLYRRMKHEPVQYIIGEQEFCGLRFCVQPDVLIPRPETELLAEAVFKQSEGKRVLDMCTGSGCIAIAVERLGTPAFVAASDASVEALAIAKKNAAQLDANVKFFQGDLFENVEGAYDIIVSNPPYIASGDVDELMSDVREFEPRMALDGAEDGLLFYRRICAEAKRYLVPRGKLMFEIGHDQGKTVPEILSAEGYVSIEVKKDYAGLDRMVFAVWPDDNKEI